MKPTAYLRFVWRKEIVEHDKANNATIARPVRVLQQFWEAPSGEQAVGDGFNVICGTWRDVPLVEQE